MGQKRKRESTWEAVPYSLGERSWWLESSVVMMVPVKMGGFRFYLELELTGLADRWDVGWGEKLWYLIGL